MLPGITSGSLRAMITFLYTGALCLNSDNVLPLHFTAEQLQIKTAVELCKRFRNDAGMLLPIIVPSQNVDSTFDKVSNNMALKDICIDIISLSKLLVLFGNILEFYYI